MGGQFEPFSDLSIGSSSSGMEKLCHCRLPAVLLTAIIEANYGHRFLRCPLYSDKTLRCVYFKWVDPKRIDDTSNHSIVRRQVEEELRTQILALESEVRRVEDQLTTRILLLDADVNKWKYIAKLIIFFIMFCMVTLPYKFSWYCCVIRTPSTWSCIYMQYFMATVVSKPNSDLTCHNVGTFSLNFVH